MGKWVHRLLSYEGDRGVCAECGPVPVVWTRKKEKSPRCKTSVDKYKDSPNRRKWGQETIRTTKGDRHPKFTPQERIDFLTGKICEICKKTESLRVDHCHQSQTIRGVLCHHCNIGIGFFRDDPDLLTAAIAYLQKSREPALPE